MGIFQKKKSEYQVYLTSDTIRGILLEVSRHPKLECIIQMPGVRIGNDFYFDLVADSGMNAAYEYGKCEKDHEYVDHLSTRLSEYYDIPAGSLTVSQVHKHPPGYTHFSPGDRPANVSLARQFGGVVNGLILVDPEFKLKFWYIDERGNEVRVPYIMDDEAVHRAMPRKSLRVLRSIVEGQEASVNVFKGRKQRSAMDIMSLNKEFLDEVKKLSHTTDIHVNKTGDNVLIISAGGSDKKMRSVYVTVRGKALHMCNDKEEKVYRPGDVRRLLKMEDENMGEDMELFEMEEQEKKEFEALMSANIPYTVFLPEEYKAEQYEGPLMGYYIDETKVFNVVSEEVSRIRKDCCVIGEACRDEASLKIRPDSDDFIIVTWNEDMPAAEKYHSDAIVNIEFYSLRKDLFSRNQGILESDQMNDKQAIISGVGSGGSLVALELARAGIGSLILADDDRFSYHNICRHQCGIHDVGKYKVDALAERIADINPFCRLYTFRDIIQHVDPAALEDALWNKSIILCCADNRHAGYVCNELADRYHIPMISAGCGPRASTGEIFYYKPDCDMPCHTCAYGEDIGVDYSNQAVRRAFYATETELEKMHFQPECHRILHRLLFLRRSWLLTF